MLTFRDINGIDINISEATDKDVVGISMEDFSNQIYLSIDLEVNNLKLLREWIDKQIELLEK